MASGRTKLLQGIAIALSTVGVGVIGFMTITRSADGYIEFNNTLQNRVVKQTVSEHVEQIDCDTLGENCRDTVIAEHEIDVTIYPEVQFPRGVPGLKLPLDSGDVIKITYEQTFAMPDTTIKDTVIAGVAAKDTVVTKGARSSWTYPVNESGLSWILKFVVRK